MSNFKLNNCKIKYCIYMRSDDCFVEMDMLNNNLELLIKNYAKRLTKLNIDINKLHGTLQIYSIECDLNISNKKIKIEENDVDKDLFSTKKLRALIKNSGFYSFSEKDFNQREIKLIKSNNKKLIKKIYLNQEKLKNLMAV